MVPLLRYHILKVNEFLFNIPIERSGGIQFLYPKGNFISVLEETGCFSLKGKTDMLIEVKIVSVLIYFLF